jgi:hypothetical protein
MTSAHAEADADALIQINAAAISKITERGCTVRRCCGPVQRRDSPRDVDLFPRGPVDLDQYLLFWILCDLLRAAATGSLKWMNVRNRNGSVVENL